MLTSMTVVTGGFRPRINIKKLYHEKKQAMQAKKPATGKKFFTSSLWLSMLCDGFMLVQRAFHSGSITLFEINLVHN